MTCSMIWMKALRGCVRFRALCVAVATLFSLPAQAESLKVFAAASLTDALDKALEVCTSDSDTHATGVYAGSGTLARQIEQGAPADLYISANPQWMDWLEKRGMIASETRFDLLGNRLVLAAARDAEGGTPQLEGIEDFHHKFSFAAAETNSVPAGIYARQALEAQGWWDGVRDHLIQASNVREVLTWVIREEVTLGVVYRTDALNEPRAVIAHEFSPETHDPIRYPAAVVADNDSPNARRLLACLKGEEASEVFRQFGFTILAQ